MKLKKIIYNNYRSFGPKESAINITDLTAFIGENSSGKTTILTGLQKMFGNLKIEKTDFHVPLDKPADEIKENYFSIETYFEFFNNDDGEAEDNYAIPHYFENFVVEEPNGKPYIIIRLEANYEKGNTPDGVIDTSFYYVTSKDTDGYKPMSVRDRSKIQVMYIPAVRNPINQLKNASGTILWRILNQINWKDTDIVNINKKIDEVDVEVSKQRGISKVTEIISSEWKKYHTDDRYTEANIKFGSNEIDNILKKLEVEFTPTHADREFKVEDLGDGLKSLFYLTLINTLLELENDAIKEIEENTIIEERILNIEPPALTLVLVEEPENHISPHLLGKVIKNLKNIKDRNNSQILITSHNPSIIKRVDPTEIRHLRIEKGESIVNEILLPSSDEDAHKYVKEAVKAFPELYFSSLVILGEGDSEEILIPKFLDLYIDDLDAIGISIVPLGGRHVNHFWKLLTQLEIPYITLLDLDIGRHGGGWGRIKYALKQLIEKGVNREQLLALKNGEVLSNDKLEGMHKRNANGYEYIDAWINLLQRYNVFFSSPLDIDFLMIEKFLEFYIDTLTDREGPQIKLEDESFNIKINNLTEVEKLTVEYNERVESDLGKVLKENGDEGNYYTNEQKELMVWYSYFFLGRGKPVTHLQALNLITSEQFTVNTPIIFKEIAAKTKEILNIKD